MSEIATIMAALPRIEQACRRRGVRDLATGVSLTDGQLRTLAQLDPLDPVMVTELADFLGVTPSTMSLNLKRLEAIGLIHRSRDPADRRVMNVRLTAEGARIRTLASPVDPARVATVLDRLRPEERARVVGAFARFAEAADEVRSG